MVHLHKKYNGSACEKDKISCGTFVCGSQVSGCVKNNIIMARLHMENIVSACVQDRTSILARPPVTNKFCGLN